MYYVELDTNNLAKWFLGAAAPFNDGVGSLAKNDNNGYIVYFSDRRNNRNAANRGNRGVRQRGHHQSRDGRRHGERDPRCG